MANQIKKGRANWKTAALGAALGASGLGGLLLTNALAVHNSPFPFEIDGNVTNDTGDSRDDCQNVFGLDGVVPPATGTPVAGGGEVFLRDLPDGNPKETQYDAGKDTQDVDDWTRKEVSKVVPDKDNITDAFAKVYMVDHDGAPGTAEHRVIYFGMDRFANNGDAALGFWFFQNEVELTGSNGFSPGHTAYNAGTGQRGDILVQVDFFNGGAQSRIEVFEWYGTGGNTGGTLQLLRTAVSNGTTVCLSDDTACATANAGTTGSYWPYTPKFGTSGRFPAQSLFEGGIDITALVGDVCFNSFLANTRTSHSETADLKDLALGDFSTCGSIDLVRKECSEESGVSPYFDPVSELYQTKHVLTIRNDGQGSNIFDVQIRDDAVSSENVCNIIAISGGVNPVNPGAGIPIPDNTTWIQVADELAPGVANQMTVTLLCQSSDNPFANEASVRAGQTNGGNNLSDSYSEGEEDTCPLSLSPSLEVTKTCDDVTLDPTNGFKPLVCVDISITNTSDPAQKVDVTSFMDEHEDGTSDDLLAEIPEIGGVHVLDPGQTINVLDHCYTPTAPDADQTDPDLAQYSDKTTAAATGHASGTAEAESLTATCDLCPTGQDGAP
jgi:hypothetical protein